MQSNEEARPAVCNVLWLIKGLGPGGAEHLLVSAARASESTTTRYSVAYVLGWKDTMVPALEAAGVEVTWLGVQSAFDFRYLLRLRRLIKKGGFDVLHVHSPVLAAATRLVRLTLRNPPPLVSTEHNTWRSHRALTQRLNRLGFRRDNAHIAVSNAVRDSIPAHLRKDVEVIVHGVDLEALRETGQFRDEVRSELGLADSDIAVLTVANLRWQKGYPDLLAAARIVLDANPHVRFFAVGQGPLEDELRERHRQLELGSRFVFLGYRSDAVRLLAGADIFALASLHEGYPIAVMEAMAMGLPVVATAAGGVPIAVRSGTDGVVVEPKDPQSLGAAIAQLAADRELMQAMGAAAAERAAMFDIRSSVRRTEEIYRSVASAS